MTNSEENQRSKRRRSSAACSFCKQRKLKCDNAKPRCGNCQSYDRTCHYEVRKSSRPTNARIRDLEQEIDRLKSAATDTSVGHGSPPGTVGASNDAVALENPEPATVETESGYGLRTTRPQPDRDTEPHYYGTTSTLFNADEENARTGSARAHIFRSASPLTMQNSLVAAAAKQKQMETINFNRNKLDFDGVDPDLGMHLLQLHWARQHHSFLLTYRPAFMRDMACNGPYFSKLLLNAIYFGAAKVSPRLEVRRDPTDVRTAGWLYRERVKTLLAECLDKSHVTTIQALLVMTNSLFALGDERSAAWLYAGIAIRMIIDLGMHIDCEESPRALRMNYEDIEIRRRVFWGAFVVDKIQSLYQGRPAALQDFDTRVCLNFLDTYEDFEYWLPFAYNNSAPSYPGSPAYSVSTFTELCKLSVIMNKVLNKMYSAKGIEEQTGDLVKCQKALNGDLETWRQQLPEHLEFDASASPSTSPPPHVLSLLEMYDVVLVILHRPFVSTGHLHTGRDQRVAAESWAICIRAASSIVHLLRAYDRNFSVKRAPYLIAYATYVAATIHVRVAAQMASPSSSHSMLADCLNVFQQNRETNWAVRRAETVITRLMKSMHVDVDMGRSTNLQSCDDDCTDPSTAARNILGDVAGMTEPVADQAIDIDMIIQSFQPDRNSGLVVHQNALDPGQQGDNTLRLMGTQNARDGSNQQAMEFDYAGMLDYSINDPLFGFYGSPGDIQWMFDPSIGQIELH